MGRIRLVLSDLDGTLSTPDKTVTPASIEAIHELRRSGIDFAVTSGRPPKGMRTLLVPLGLSSPMAGFNGGMIVDEEGKVLERHCLPERLVTAVLRHLEGYGVDAWLYRGDEWLLRDAEAPHVKRESFAVKYDPTVVPSFEGEGRMRDIVKIVGVSDERERLERCESALREELGGLASASRSQPYYLDVTHRCANKGYVLERFSRLLGVPPDQIATLGDMPNDLLMFEKSGFSIAMGNASPEVKSHASAITSGNAEEGFARAIRELVLKRAG